VEISGSCEISTEVKTALFRVAQEALTNVVRHANARTAQVSLVFSADRVTLSVQDDGCGFDLDRLQNVQRPSWGLLGMEERASLLGGELSIVSKPGLGSLVKVTIPYIQKMDEVFDEDTLAISG
jgi:two-component system NarL family sensor kinase